MIYDYYRHMLQQYRKTIGRYRFATVCCLLLFAVNLQGTTVRDRSTTSTNIHGKQEWFVTVCCLLLFVANLQGTTVRDRSTTSTNIHGKQEWFVT